MAQHDDTYGFRQGMQSVLAQDWDSPQSIPAHSIVAARPLTAAPAATAPTARRYEKISVLGQGGMGKVWLGWDNSLSRNVAIKEPNPNEQAIAYLEREASTTAKLDHPHIVSIYDIYTPDEQRSGDTRHFVMALVPGISLAQWLEQCPDHERTRALRYILEVCEAVGHAHQRSIVHRDLSPNNILVTQDGSARVIDWGLAISLDQSTLPAGYAGTPGYIAPEQRTASLPSPQADVWSLGALLHLILLGTSPDTPPSSPRALDPELEAIMRHAISADPQTRYPDASKMADDLRRWFEGRRVEVYDFPLWRLGWRFIKTHSVPTLIALGGLIALAASLSWGVINIQKESKRAAIAERQALGEVAQNRKTLSELYNDQALRAYKTHDLFEAERLAILSVEQQDNPIARGLLSAISMTPHATLSATTQLPPCPLGWILTEQPGWLICREGVELLSIWHHQQRLWQIKESIWQLRVKDDKLYIINGPRQLNVFDMKTGAPLEHDPNAGMFTEDGALTRYQAVKPGSLTPGYPDSPCKIAAKLNASTNGQHWIVCTDQEVWHLGAQQEPQKLIIPEAQHIGALAKTASGIWAGTQSGLLVRVDQPDTVAIHDGPIGKLEAIPNQDHLLLVIGTTGSARVFDTQRQAWLLSLPRAGQLRVDQNGDIWTLRDGRTLQRWQLPKNSLPQAIPTSNGLSALTYFAPSQRIFAGSGSGDITTIDLKAQTSSTHHIPGATQAVKAFVYDAKDKRYYVSSSMLHTLAAFDPMQAPINIEQTTAPGNMRRMALLEDGRLLTFSYGNAVYISTGDTQWAERKLVPTPETIDLQQSPHHKRALIVTKEDAYIIRTGDKEDAPPTKRANHGNATASAIYDDDTVASAIQNTLMISRPGEQAPSHATLPSLAMQLKWSDDGKRLAVGTLDGSILIYDTHAKLLATILTHNERVSAIAFSPDGKALFSASWDAHIQRFDLEQLALPLSTLKQRAIQRWGNSPTHDPS